MLIHCPGRITCPGLPVLWEIKISLYKKYSASGQILLLHEHLPLNPQEVRGLPTKSETRGGPRDNSYF